MRVSSLMFSVIPYICVALADYAVKQCPCDPMYCRVHKYSFNQEVAIVAEGKTDHTKWLWHDITTVIATETVSESKAQKLMCTAHQNHANFAFTEKVPTNTNTSDPALLSWLDKVIKKRDRLYADYVALDLLELLGQCQADNTHVTEVLELLKFIVTKSFTTQNAELLCIVPYKPPCYNGDCSLSKYMAEHCAAFITSPESFITCDTNTNCIAKATMPMTSVVFGVELYIDHGISPDKLIIGIPWHGFDYTCVNITKNKKAGGRKDEMTCKFAKENGSEVCDLSHRKKISLAEIKASYPEQYKSAKSHHFQKIYRSDYINVMKNGQQHQIWYEGHDSLLDKYMFIRSLQLKGMVIWTGDDLSAKGIEDDVEWNWILHGLFSKGEIQEHDLNMAGTVAGVSVACFVLGSLLGFAFGCALMRRRMNRRGLRLPFHKDEEETDFHDDDNTL